SGRYFGWMCMSIRQPSVSGSASIASAGNRRVLSMELTGHLRYRARSQTFEKLPRTTRGVLGIGRKDDQEKTILTGKCKARNVKDRMVRHGKSVQCQHAEYCGKPGKQDGHLERHHDKSRPRMVRPSSHVDGIADSGDPVLQQVAREAAQDTADQYNQGNPVAMEADGLGELLDR